MSSPKAERVQGENLLRAELETTFRTSRMNSHDLLNEINNTATVLVSRYTDLI